MKYYKFLMTVTRMDVSEDIHVNRQWIISEDRAFAPESPVKDEVELLEQYIKAKDEAI
jgi:hypothetical protein